MNSATTPIKTNTGRGWMWLGLAMTILGIVAYVILLLGFRSLHIPWYTPVLGILGVGLCFLAVRQKPGLGRYAALALCSLLLVGELFFLFSVSKLPQYAGPVVTGQAFPPFTSKLADGATLTNNDLAGSQNTALIFYRGHW